MRFFPPCAGPSVVRVEASAGWGIAALALVVAAGASFLSSTPRVELNLGPGDSPFVTGFQRDSEVENKVGWHWTSYHASIDLPFQASRADVDTTLRYARVFGEEAVVELRVGGVSAERFRARGGEIRVTTLPVANIEGPLVVAIEVDSHERRDMGLRMDTITLQAVAGTPFKLAGKAALRPVIATAALLAGFLILGASPFVAGSLVLIGAVAFALGASADLFTAWRQTRMLPEMIVIATLVLLPIRRFMERRMAMDGAESRALAVASLVTMILRLVLVNHPDFYYPDLLTHARVVDAIRAEGPSFFLHPADALNAQGAWTKPVLGSVASLPYAVAFHAPFAIMAARFDWPLDGIEGALKAGATLISVLPILFAGCIAVRLSIPPMSAIMLAVIPTHASRLSFALLPALLGHALDLIVLLSVLSMSHDRALRRGRPTMVIALALTLGHLTYTSSVVNEGVFVVCLALLWVVSRSVRSALCLLGAEAVAVVAAFALYYRHFMGDALSLFTRLLGLGARTASSASSGYPIEGFWAVLLERTSSFFGWPYVALAVAGAFLYPTARRSKFVQAWGLSYLALIILRAKIPDVFRYGHETLYLTPLVALLAGSTIVAGWRAAGAKRLLSAGFASVLAAWSLWHQWLAVRDQLGNAL